ncbi:MAG TPA: PKD domain-containing protein, partial [Bacteroidales bacterium]|nr:PKD domain-containing protein [Bacteroidales bacterium]
MLTIRSVAQVCCPDFILKDAVEICASDFNCHSGSPAGNGGTMVACKLTPHTYTVYPNLPGYSFSWTVIGGTAPSYTSNPIVVTWGSGTTGYLTVVINGNGCHDSITQSICLIDGPQAGFTVAPNPVCSGTPVNFTNTSMGGGAYLWDFGDGTTSTLANPPAHVYTTPGTYTVVLTATDPGAPKQGTDIRTPCGCSDTAMRVITVLNGAGPKIETTCCYGTVCPGDTSSFCTPVICTTYNWSVAGGVIISGSGTNCIKVKWNATYSGPTSVSLAVPGCGSAPCPGTATLPVPVLYPNLPISGPNPICAGSAGSYFLPSMPGTYYQWSTTAPAGTYTFNDKNRNVAGINITFNIQGTYQIQCNYNNPLSGCSGSSVITVNVLPVFSVAGNDVVCQGSSETYYATGNANWSVSPAGATVPSGAGSTKTITWNTPGTYTITASPTAVGVYCNTSAIKIVRVVAVPILSAISGPNLVCPGKNLTYSVSSNVTGSPFTWSVISGSGSVQTQFGPDQSSAIILLSGGPSWTVQVVQQIEISPGVFCSSAPQMLVVNKYSPPTISGPSTVCVDAVTTFTAGGPTPPGGFQWSILPPFANRGTILSGQGTSLVNIRWHGTPATGVVVAVSTCGGSASTTVNIANPPAMPAITANGPLSYCLPSMPNNLTLSVPAVYCSYQWSLNGTSIPGATNAVYAIPNATFSTSTPSYIFSVTVSNCICSVTANVQVLIGNCGGGGGNPPNPVPCAIDFTINPNPVCENQYATFTATPAGVFQLQWDFGDGATSFQSPTQHAYLTAGTYNVTVTATLGTCVATKVHSITVNP